MASTELWTLGLVELSRLLRARKVSSLEAVEAALARLDRLQSRLNAFVTVLPEQARSAARQADEELARGQRRGPLHGVPVSVKDMFYTAGVRTTGGSRLRADWIPDQDATLVEHLRAAGAVLLGKTNLDEFGHGAASTRSHFGAVHNPWDLDRVAGGSSGGSAAAVAAGIGPLSYGTETGSSVRRPAAFCGIVGVKPTFGIISRCGSFHTAWSMDHAGIFARSMEDAALGLDAVAGHDPRDPASVRQGPAAYASGLEPGVRGLRVGVPRRFLQRGIEPQVGQAFDTALGVLADLGAEVCEVHVPEIRYAAMTAILTSSAEAAADSALWLRERPGDFQPEVRPRLAAGLGMTASEYLMIQRARSRIANALRDAFDGFHLLAAPTTGTVAPLVAAPALAFTDPVLSADDSPGNLHRLPSLLGLPACSVPCGANPDGLPIGLQLVGRWFADQVVLNAALAYEQATNWSGRRPPVD